jgi:septal ring factor EnvC (AmiA/AmiB activator)
VLFYKSMFHSRKLFLVLFLSLISFVSLAQKSKVQLEREKRENLKRIQEANRILEETRTEKTATIGQLNAISQQVESHKKLIDGITKEIYVIESEMAGIRITTKNLQTDLKNLKTEYASMVYAASKASSYDKLLFIFSSSTVNQFLMRIKYMQYYAEARREQAQQIEKIRSSLMKQQKQLQAKRSEKATLLAAQLEENKKLLALKTEQAQLISKLTNREKELKNELAERAAADDKLEKLIADLIRSEIKKSARIAAKGKASDANKITLTPEAANISASFEGNKQKLIWPVQSGFISGKFGKHPHPILKNIIIENQGVDIQTNKGEKVRVVFDGEVGFVASIPGKNGKIVSVQHGDYFTVYAGLREVNINPGQRIKAKDIIGEVYTDKDGISELQFQIWKNNERLDPQVWLFNK